MFEKRFLGLPWGRNCKFLSGNIWRKTVSTFGARSSFFAAVLSEMNSGSVVARVV